MSRFGWAYVNSLTTGSATAAGSTNSVQYNSGSGVFGGSSNFTFNPATNTLTVIGTISASAYQGVSGSGGSTSPGGSNTYLQYNSGSTVAGKSNLTFDYTTNILNLTGTMYAQDFTGSVSGVLAQFTTLTASIGKFDTIIVNRISTSSSISLTSTQHIIAVNTSGAVGNVTLSLPNASTLPSGKHYVIKDEGGKANSKNIILSCSIAGQTIDGNSSVTANSPYAALNIYCDGTSKYFIY
jgi:hypothetical protein